MCFLRALTKSSVVVSFFFVATCHVLTLAQCILENIDPYLRALVIEEVNKTDVAGSFEEKFKVRVTAEACLEPSSERR